MVDSFAINNWVADREGLEVLLASLSLRLH